MSNYIFHIKMSRALSVLFLFMGAIFLSIGVEMVFLHKFIPVQDEFGFKFGGWFFLITGALVAQPGGANLLNPMTLIAVTRKGINIKAKPGPTRQLTMIPWDDISSVDKGEIYMSSGRGGRTVHKTIKFVFRKGSPFAASRITDGMVRWGSEAVDFDSTYFSVDLEALIKTLKEIKTAPGSFDELNLDVKYFLEHKR